MISKLYSHICDKYAITPYCLNEKGRKVLLAPAAQRQLLAAFGIDLSEEKDQGQLFDDLVKEYWQRLVDPCLVVPENTTAFAFHLRLPESKRGQLLYWHIQEENGNSRHGESDLAEALAATDHEIEGGRYVDLEIALSVSLPCGYHFLTIWLGDGLEFKETCRLISTPAACYTPPGLQQDKKIWGMSCQLGTLRSGRNWGIGDFADLRSLLTWSSRHGAGTVAVNTFQSSFLSAAQSPLPGNYNSLSFLDPLYLAPEEMIDFHESHEAFTYANHPTFKVRLAALRDSEAIDFQEVALAKNGLFEICWRHFRENHLEPDSDRGREFRFFQEAGGEELQAFSLFEALRQHCLDKGEGFNWHNWPEEYRTPASAVLSDFANQNKERIEYHQYLQWQTGLQLAAIGRRSMELGLKVGLWQTLAVSVDDYSFETWYRPDLYVPSRGGEGMVAHPKPSLFLAKLAEVSYGPLIAMLRANMHYAGALAIPLQLIEEEQSWPGQDEPASVIYVKQPVLDLLGIIALESVRNRCQVVCRHEKELADHFRVTLADMAIFTYRPGHFERESDGSWISPAHYPNLAAVAASDDHLTSLNGFWLGKDLEMRDTVSAAGDAFQREEQIITRAAERAKLLVVLHRQGLLPDEYDMDPTTVSWLTPELVRAVHFFLVQTASKVFLLPLQDLPSLQEEKMTDEESFGLPGWQHKLGLDLETFAGDEQFQGLVRSFCLERGVGVVRPSALLTDRRTSKATNIPRAFYRLQLNKEFTFQQAAEVVPYLHLLGISHCYSSPCLKARPDSPHGYDIIDHTALNPELGSRENFEGFVAALEHHHMAQVIDIVPNHMGVGSDNRWWMDILENGQASFYADFFDINWQPQEQELQGRVLLPILGDHYGLILESGQLRLDFSLEKGSFWIHYYEHCFPVAPRSYPVILGHDLQRLERQLGDQHNGLLELQNLIFSFANLPDRQETGTEQRETRRRNKKVLKRLLARLCREVLELADFIRENVIFFNGEQGRPESFDLLHGLLAMQSYRLAFWRVAADEINYRRFFDINNLAGIRMENQLVFDETHRLVLDLVATGKVDGLRIDHPDGLYDPQGYFYKLQEAVSDDTVMKEHRRGKGEELLPPSLPLYVVVEKILCDFEHLPQGWPVHGTTGYDFGIMVNGIFVDQSREQEFTRIYHKFIGHSIHFDDLLYRCKKLIIKTSMAGELNVLATKLNRLAKMSRSTQDYTLNRLRDTLVEIVAHFPVYRTYLSTGAISQHDRNFIEWAIAKAREEQRAEDVSIYDFLTAVLLLEPGQEQSRELQSAARDFVMKFQQYTGPVMAKGLEDTSFYIANRLLSLNEVGGDPRRFGISLAAFHHGNRERMKHHPHGMLNTSTHDSKRSGDVRARINVLSEIPQEWRAALERWRSCNSDKRTRVAGRYAPSRNDEYALYQNLIGVWSFGETSGVELASFTDRMEQYMLKVIREAKVHTSWINRNPAYEEAMTGFVRGILAGTSPFWQEFLPFQRKVAWWGIFNSLAQLLLKLTSPGIPDVYQGSELWHFCLVDPDNRRPVDFTERRAALAELQNVIDGSGDGLSEQVRQLLDDMTDSRVKLYTLWKTLDCRCEYSNLFERGAYLPLVVEGEKELHICAFMRQYGEQRLLVAVPRLIAGLLDYGESCLPLGREVWLNTDILLPENLPLQPFRNVFTGEQLLVDSAGIKRLEAAECFNSFPVCLLLQTIEGGNDHE